MFSFVALQDLESFVQVEVDFRWRQKHCYKLSCRNDLVLLEIKLRIMTDHLMHAWLDRYGCNQKVFCQITRVLSQT